MEELLTLHEAARILRYKPRSLEDKRVRERLGLKVTRIGDRVLFARADIEALIERGREDAAGS